MLCLFFAQCDKINAWPLSEQHFRLWSQLTNSTSPFVQSFGGSNHGYYWRHLDLDRAVWPCVESNCHASSPDLRTDILSCSAPCINASAFNFGGKLKRSGFYIGKVRVCILRNVNLLTKGEEPYRIACIIVDLIRFARPVLEQPVVSTQHPHYWRIHYPLCMKCLNYIQVQFNFHHCRSCQY